MATLIIGLGFIILGVLPYGCLNWWLLKTTELKDSSLAINGSE